MKEKNAFTLAEVLITLGVIGIVAAMTLPTVVNKYKEKETISKLKKIYSILSQCYLSATQKYGSPSDWEITGRDAGSSDEDEETYNASNSIMIRDKLFESVKRLKICNNAKDQLACGFGSVYYLNGNIDEGVSGAKAKTSSVLLSDGSSVLVIANGLSDNRGEGVLSSTYAIMYIDINGLKSPNTYGKDLFAFYLTNKNIIPAGTQYETRWTFDTCHENGVGCTAWVLYNENMDYLRCDDLSWNGKTKCGK